MFPALWIIFTLALGLGAWASKPQSMSRVYWSSFFYLCCSVMFLREMYWEPFKTQGNSMSPTLSNEEVVFVNKKAYGWDFGIYNNQNWKKYPLYYDIVAFHDVKEPSNTLIKRVYAKHGDIISLTPKGWFVNDMFVSPLSSHSLLWLEHTGGKRVFSPWEEKQRKEKAQQQWYTEKKASFSIPYGYLFVLGDNQPVSRDSREFGLVPVSSVLGKVQVPPTLHDIKDALYYSKSTPIASTSYKEYL